MDDLYLHWGLTPLNQQNAPWELPEPRFYPQESQAWPGTGGTSEGALHSHFQSDESQENSRLVHIEMDDNSWSEGQAKQLSFVLFEKDHNIWYNNEGHNYHIDLTLDSFRSCTKNSEYSIEKEIGEYLEYQEHHKLREIDVQDYLSITPDKVSDHLHRLIESHTLHEPSESLA